VGNFVSKKRVKNSQNMENEVKNVLLNQQQNQDENQDETQKVLIGSKIKKLDVNFKTESQEQLWNMIESKEIIICAGDAGTGKSHISLLKALELTKKYPKKYKKIFITTPAKEADGEQMGFLPGGVEEKLAPYTYSSLYLLKKILGDVKVDRLIKSKDVEVIALAYLRGVNIDNAILICDEAQNLTKKTLKTLLTRIGEDSKFILNGDLSQSDRVDDYKKSGLYFALENLKDIPQIGLFKFKEEDIVRNPVISLIIKRFNENN